MSNSTVFAVSIALLALLVAGLGLATAVLRGRRKVFLNPEDARRDATVGDLEHPDVARLQRVHRNALENVLPFFALGSLAISVNLWSAALAYLFIVFTVSRFAHAAFYLARKSLPRTGAHTAGLLVQVALAIGIALTAI